MQDSLLLDRQVCFSLYRAGNAMNRAYRPMLDALGLTYPQYLAMLVLWQEEGLSVKSLGERLRLDSGTLTPLLKRLEHKGLISRGRQARDERVRVLHLTDEGRLLRRAAQDIPDRIRCLIGLGMEELAELKRLCDKAANLLERQA